MSLLVWIKKKNYQIRMLQLIFLFITLFFIFHVSAIWIGVSIGCYILLETFGGNIGLHRYYGHRSFKTTPVWDLILRVASHYIGVSSVISWVGQHRYHHKYSDTPSDVHCPRNTGIFHILFGIWHVKIERNMIRDVMADKKLLWWHHYYFPIHIIYMIVLLCVDLYCNTYFLFAIYAFPNLLCLISGYVLATITHWHGYKTHYINSYDQSTNSWLANIYTLGEGWHNNHHAYPSRIRQGEQPWEWDLPAFIIENILNAK